MRRILVAILLALALVVVPVMPAFAATFDDITVTATPSYISIDIAQNTWTINGIDGSGKLAIATTYYSNATGASGDVTPPSATVVDGECYFTMTNTSTVTTNITLNMPHFVSGDAMQNTDTGYTTNGANAFGASTYISGSAWPGGAVIAKNAASAAMKTGLTAGTSLLFGIAIKTQSGAWASGTSMTSAVLVTATE